MLDNNKSDQQKIENEKRNTEKALWYKRMAVSDDGKKIMIDLADHCGYNKTSVCRQQPNSNQTMYCEGIRSVFLYIQDKINRKDSNN